MTFFLHVIWPFVVLIGGCLGFFWYHMTIGSRNMPGRQAAEASAAIEPAPQ